MLRGSLAVEKMSIPVITVNQNLLPFYLQSIIEEIMKPKTIKAVKGFIVYGCGTDRE